MFLGIEIGGTKLQLGLGRGDGALLGLWRGSVESAAGGEGIRRQIVAALPELLAGRQIDRTQLRGVGVGFRRVRVIVEMGVRRDSIHGELGDVSRTITLWSLVPAFSAGFNF